MRFEARETQTVTIPSCGHDGIQMSRRERDSTEYEEELAELSFRYRRIVSKKQHSTEAVEMRRKR
jgi:hypothetical protein